MENNYKLRSRTYFEYEEFLHKELHKSMDAFFTGADHTNTLPLWNMMFLLLQMRHEDYASARPTQKEIDCMTAQLLCYGVDAFKLSHLWPPSYISEGDSGELPGDGRPPEETIRDGISFMSIESLTKPIFRIK